MVSPKNGFTLIDSEQRQKDHPDTWSHLSISALKQIVPGFLVKIGVCHPIEDGERFWAIVQEKSDQGIRVKVDNDLFLSDKHGIRIDDELLVQEKHIFDIGGPVEQDHE